MSTIEIDALKQIRISNLARLATRAGSGSKLAARLGKSPQQINDMLRGTKSFGPRVARQIEEKLDLPVGALDVQDASLDAQIPVATLNFKKVPVLSYVQAGLPCDGGQEQYDEWAIAPATVPDRTYALRVRGDSMLPLFHEGQLLFVDPCRSPIPGDYVIARSTSGVLPEVTFKKYVVTGYDSSGRERFDLRPLNPDYPVLHSDEHSLEVIGVVCGSFSTF